MTNRPETENRSRMDNTGTQITLSTRPKTKTNKTKTKKAQQIKLKMNKTYSTKKKQKKTTKQINKKPELAKGKQFLPLITYPQLGKDITISMLNTNKCINKTCTHL
jgi:hypothetical protein